jgi:ParB family chromosome partitioning protein
MSKRKGFSSLIQNAPDNIETSSSEHQGFSSSENSILGKNKPVQKKEKLVHIADPKRCKVWAVHDRAAVWFTEENCADLITSWRAIGQQKTVIARRIENDPQYDYEIIEGARRRWTAEFLGSKLELEVRAVSDQEAAAMMESENADRQDISPFERALSYQRFIDKGIFESAREVGRALNISKSNIATNVGAAKLNNEPRVMALFSDLRDIPLRPACKLVTLMEKEPELKGAVLAEASMIQKLTVKPAASKILKRLIDATIDKPANKPLKVYEDENGKKWVTAESKRGEIVLKITEQDSGISKREHKKLVNQALADYL